MNQFAYYMHPITADVQTGAEWQADKDAMDPELWGNGDEDLIEVVLANGEWVEA